MATDKEIKLAQSAYATLCKALDQRQWHYKKDEEKLIVTLGVNGDDIPMDLIIQCDASRQLIRLLSFLPFKMAEDKRVEGALATCHVNYKLADGTFSYDYADGTIVFNMTSSFRESIIGPEVFDYMIDCACFTIDRYNDKFLIISKGMLSIEDFINEK